MNYNFNSWCDHVTETAHALGFNRPDKESRANLVYFYNDPSHYHLRDNVAQLEAHLWQLHIIAVNPSHKVDKIEQIASALQEAMQKRLNIPVTFPIPI